MRAFASENDLQSYFDQKQDNQSFKLGGIAFRFVGVSSEVSDRAPVKTRKYRNEDEQISVYVQSVNKVVIKVLTRYELGDQWT